MELKKYKLGEFVQSYGDGIHGTPEYNESGEYYFINGNNLETGKIVITDNTLRITETEYQKIKRLIVKGKTILVSINGTLGRYAIYNGEKISLGKSACFLNLKDAKDVPFILTVVKAKEFTSYLERIAGQSTIKNVSPTQVINYEFYAPALYENCLKNSTFLLKLDRKIELNRLINQNLEAMAKQLYDYWFVQFDFPNEEGKPYKSSGGEMVWNEKLKRDIPASWKTKAIEDIADVYNGATPSTVNEQNYGGDIVWITPKDLSDQKQKFVYQGERNISQAGYNSCSTHLLPPNTILMSSRAPIGLLSIAKTELCTNQGFKSFVPKAENISTYLYYYLNIHIKQIEQLGTGTTFKEVSREDVLKFPILKPSDAILGLWEKRVSALNNKQFVIQKENEFLTKQRDEFRPLLMNGQVSVNSDLAVLYIIYGLKYQNYEREHHSGDSCENAA